MSSGLRESLHPRRFIFISRGAVTRISRRLSLLFRMLGRQLDEHVFERRADFVNLSMTDAHFAQLFVYLRALDALIDQTPRIWCIACSAVVT